MILSLFCSGVIVSFVVMTFGYLYSFNIIGRMGERAFMILFALFFGSFLYPLAGVLFFILYLFAEAVERRHIGALADE